MEDMINLGPLVLLLNLTKSEPLMQDENIVMALKTNLRENADYYQSIIGAPVRILSNCKNYNFKILSLRFC